MKGLLVFLVGLFSLLYLLLPSILPDQIPIIGALDEVTATTILLSCLSYFGYDLTRLFKRADQAVNKTEAKGAKGAKGAEGDVIDVDPEG